MRGGREVGESKAAACEHDGERKVRTVGGRWPPGSGGARGERPPVAAKPIRGLGALL